MIGECKSLFYGGVYVYGQQAAIDESTIVVAERVSKREPAEHRHQNENTQYCSQFCL
jgi:hypothetical protein